MQFDERNKYDLDLRIQILQALLDAGYQGIEHPEKQLFAKQSNYVNCMKYFEHFGYIEANIQQNRTKHEPGTSIRDVLITPEGKKELECLLEEAAQIS
jgi:hypothetical protein